MVTPKVFSLPPTVRLIVSKLLLKSTHIPVCTSTSNASASILGICKLLKVELITLVIFKALVECLEIIPILLLGNLDIISQIVLVLTSQFEINLSLFVIKS